MAYPYYSHDSKFFFSAKETAYRTNAHGKDTANQAADTFYPFPLVLEDGWTQLRQRKLFTTRFTPGSRFISDINHEGLKDIILTFSGPVLDHSLFLYFGTDICTTTDNTPEAGKYTHQCDSDDTFPAAPPSFQILRKAENGTSAENIWNLYVGCIVTSYTEKVGTNGVIIGTYTINCARVIDGVALTTEPARNNLDSFKIDQAVLTWTKATVAYKGLLKNYSLNYNTNKMIWKGATEVYPQIPLMATQIDFNIDIKFLTYETDTYDDSQDDPHAAQNKDLVLKMSRDATNDYIQYSFDNLFQDLLDNEFDRVLLENHKIQLNPHETGSKWDITEVNELDDDRYET